MTVGSRWLRQKGMDIGLRVQGFLLTLNSTEKTMQTKLLTVATLAAMLGGCGGGSGSDSQAAPTVAASSVLSFVADKTFRFTWADVGDATYYQLMENSDGDSGFTQVGSNIVQGAGVANHIVPLFSRVNAQYILKSCNTFGCTSSTTVSVSGAMVDSIVYLKASNTGNDDLFGNVLDVSADGNTLAVGAPREDSSATGIDGSQTDTGASNAGAVFVFTKSNNLWQQEAYIKASNTDTNDHFGSSLSLSGDGLTLVVGAEQESSNANAINGDHNNNLSASSGAVYVFHKAASSWSQQAYLKSNNSDLGDKFGALGALDVSDDGNVIAAGAPEEDSGEKGTTGSGSDSSALGAGAAYIFTRSGDSWAQTAYIKASNTGQDDNFGKLSLSGDGKTLVVSAFKEDNSATGVNSLGADNDNKTDSGAVYVFESSGGNWTQEAYIKASNADFDDEFGGGESLVISKDGLTIAVYAGGEDSAATEINGDESNSDPSGDSGAVYVFRKTAGVDGVWSQEAYIKSEHGVTNGFGGSRGIAFNKTGTSLAIGSKFNTSDSIGVSAVSNNVGSLTQAGAVYYYTRTGSSWAYTSFLKAPNTNSSDHFGISVAMDDAGDNLVIGAALESSNATGVGGDGLNNSISRSGAVYVY